MDRTMQSLFALMRLTLVDPAEAARRVRALELPMAALWQAAALVVVLSVLFTELAVTLSSSPPPPMFAAMRANPVVAVGLQAMVLFVIVHATHRIGAAFGGTGGFADSLKLVVWLQAMLLALQLVQIVAAVLVPPLAALIGLAALALFFWMLTSFVMVLHGFESRGKVFLGIVMSFIAIIFGLTVILAMLGVFVMPEATG